jgi:hypothetical protein
LSKARRTHHLINEAKTLITVFDKKVAPVQATRDLSKTTASVGDEDVPVLVSRELRSNWHGHP